MYSVQNILQSLNAEMLKKHPEIDETFVLEYKKGMLIRVGSQDLDQDSINWKVSKYGYYSMFRNNIDFEMDKSKVQFANIQIRSILLGKATTNDLASKLLSMFVKKYTNGYSKVFNVQSLEIDKIWVQQDELIKELYINRNQDTFTKVNDIFRDEEVGISAIDYTIRTQLDYCFMDSCN